MTIKKIMLVIGLIFIICVILVFGLNFYSNYIEKHYFIETMVFNGNLDDWEYSSLVNVTEEEMDEIPYLKKAIDENIRVEITRAEKSKLDDFFYEKGKSSGSPSIYIYYDNIYYYTRIYQFH